MGNGIAGAGAKLRRHPGHLFPVFQFLRSHVMSETRHRPYRPPIGMPSPKQNRAGSAMASLAFHLLLLLLLIGPIWMQAALDPTMQGAGGPGPSGGGGGGAGGSGGLVKERLRYVMIALPPAATPILQPVVTPPVVKPPEPEKPITPRIPLPSTIPPECLKPPKNYSSPIRTIT